MCDVAHNRKPALEKNGRGVSLEPEVLVGFLALQRLQHRLAKRHPLDRFLGRQIVTSQA